jgi:hypothetical protein
MAKITRWIAIIISLFMACAVLQAAPTAQKHTRKRPSHRITHHVRHYRRHRRYRRRHYHRRRVRLPRQPSRERTEQIQTALERGGYYTGEPNGRWDAKTVSAVQKFQSTHSLDATGKLDAPTLQKLGLGSAIAGVAAPKPVVPKDCCSASPPVPKPAPGAKVPASATSAVAPPKAPAANSRKPAAASSGASSAAAIAPSVNPGASGPSAPASASKPDAAQH